MTSARGSWLAIGLSSALAFGGAPVRAARAATAECIPAARFSKLARITDGNTVQLAELLGLPGQTLPEDGCRALQVQGPLTRGSAATVLAAIERNKGWLAKIYLAVGDGDLREEIALAHLMRDFQLSVTIVAEQGVYTPDFMFLPRIMPSSVSNSWTDSQRGTRTPLDASLTDYLDNTNRKLTAYPGLCGASCWTIAAGAIERRHVGKTQSFSARHTQAPDAARIRDAVRQEFGVKGQPTIKGADLTLVPPIAMYATFDRREIDAECRTPLEYASTLQDEIAKASNALAVHSFPFMRLGPLQQKIRRYNDASASAEVCMRKALTRQRRKTFEQICKTTCADELTTAMTAAAQTLARFGVPDRPEQRLAPPVVERAPEPSPAPETRANPASPVPARIDPAPVTPSTATTTEPPPPSTGAPAQRRVVKPQRPR